MLGTELWSFTRAANSCPGDETGECPVPSGALKGLWRLWHLDRGLHVDPLSMEDMEDPQWLPDVMDSLTP